MAYKTIGINGETSSVTTANSGTAVTSPTANSTSSYWILNESDSAVNVHTEVGYIYPLAAGSITGISKANPAVITLSDAAAATVAANGNPYRITVANVTGATGFNRNYDLRGVSGNTLLTNFDSSAVTGTGVFTAATGSVSTVEDHQVKVGRGRRVDGHKSKDADSNLTLPGVAVATLSIPTGATSIGGVVIEASTTHKTSSQEDERIYIQDKD